MTYRKISQIAGVSLSTVSKALSGSDDINAETAERIRKIAEENGVIRPKYRKARSIVRVAIIVPEIISVFYSTIVSSLVEELRSSGIEPYIQICGFDDKTLYGILDMLTGDNITDGVILLADKKPLHKLEIPTVIINKSVSDASYDVIDTDTSRGIFEAFEYLVSIGHRKIGFIGETHTVQKLEYFKSVAAQQKIPVDPSDIFVSNKRFEEIGYEAAAYYRKLQSLPTAIITAYDEIALGAIHAFTDSGIKVPDDISVIGINDIPSAAYANIPLTTLRTFDSEKYRLCVRLLLDHIINRDSHMTQHIVIQCKLIIRETTAKPKCSQINIM